MILNAMGRYATKGFVYVAGAIDDPKTATDGLEGWREKVFAAVQAEGYSVYNPAGAFAVGQTAAFSGLQEVNDEAIRQCVAVFVELARPVRHVGTLMEIGMALSMRKRVVVWNGEQYAGHASLHHPGLLADVSLVKAIEHLTHILKQQAHTERFVDFALDTEAVTPYWEGLPESFKASRTFEEWAAEQYPMPSRAYAGDLGYDLPVARPSYIEAGKAVDVPLAYRVAMPWGLGWRLVARSSTLRLGLGFHEGIMDGQYRGPSFARVFNETDGMIHLEAGRRIAQCIPVRVEADHLVPRLVEKLSWGQRGGNGFGSSGQ